MVTILLLAIIYISFISLGLPDSLLGAAWPSMYGGMSVPASYAGVISALISGCTVISSVLSQRIIRRFGTGAVTAVSVLATATALLGISFFGGFAALCFLAVPLGLGAGSVDAGLNNYVALHYKARHMSWLHCFWGLGASIGPAVMSYCLAATGSWRMGYGYIGAAQLCLAVILVFSLGLWDKTGLGENARDNRRGAPAPLRELLRIPGVLQALLSFFFYCALEATAGLWGGSYLVFTRGVDPERAAGLVSTYFLGITAGRFVSGFLTMRINNRRMVRLGCAIILCGIILLAAPYDSFPLLAGLFMVGLGCAPIFPSLLHETPESFGGENSQGIIGLQMACAYIGSAAMPPVFGILAARAGYWLLVPCLGFFLLLMAFMTEFLNRRVDSAREL